MSLSGVVVTAQQLAADAGALALRAGGSAIDGAVAAAFALCVVDPSNCGVGGYGGFLMYLSPAGVPTAVEFDTWVPRRFPSERLRSPGATGTQAMAQGGPAVAPPAVVPGLLEAHAQFGRLPLDQLLVPAIRHAREGFPVGRDLARELARHQADTNGDIGDEGIRARFYPGGRPLRAGAPLVQADLATTLETIGREGEDAFCRGRIAEAICETVAISGGWLDLDDLGSRTVVRGADGMDFGGTTVYAPTREVSGAGIVLDALERIDTARLGPNRSRSYIDEIGSALAEAWRVRLHAARAAAAVSSHTTTLASADSDGGVVALTFTHGPTLGAGVMVAETGIVLNGGANLFAPSPGGGNAVTNMSPLIVERAGARHAFGGTGGPRIPAMLTTAVVDLVQYDFGLLDAIAAPHISVRATDGRIEVEQPLAPLVDPDDSYVFAFGDFGPACGVSVDGNAIVAACDPRFERGLAVA